MAKLKVSGSASGTGTITLIAPATDTNRTITLPDEDITLGGGVDGIVSTANATAITIDSSENVGIGTATPGYTSGQQPGTFQTIYSSDTNGGILELASNKNTDNNTLGIISFVNTENSNSGATTRVYNAQIRGRIDTSDTNAGDDSGGVLEFQTKAEAGPLDVSMTIASDGNVGIGTTPDTWDSDWKVLHVGWRTTLASYGLGGGATIFKHNAYSGFTSKYQETGGAAGMYMDGDSIKFEVATSGTADATISWTTAMTILNTGKTTLGTNTSPGARLGVTYDGWNYGDGIDMYDTYSGSYSNYAIKFIRNGSVVGGIMTNLSSTAYNTSSDYRLKENVVPMTGSIDRLKALKPSKFNFIADADTTVDGFLAHEAQEVVPEAITGTKDAMKTEEYEVTPAVMDGEDVVTEAVMGEREVEDYQGIDQSKLVPLLVASLQEAIAKIEELTTRIEKLEVI